MFARLLAQRSTQGVFRPEIDAEPFTFKMLFLWERIDGEWWSHGEMYVLGEFDLSADKNLN